MVLEWMARPPYYLRYYVFLDCQTLYFYYAIKTQFVICYLVAIWNTKGYNLSKSGQSSVLYQAVGHRKTTCLCGGGNSMSKIATDVPALARFK
ncbi:MAG: hypothetical protein DDT24_00514 [Chloroflexi bacterium]|nr:hypothetical protein [Chloroflexota bacterium]